MVFDGFRGWLRRWRQPPKPGTVEVRRQGEPAGAVFDETMMAISFAEAGEPQEALNILRHRGNRKILVVGQGGNFSEGMMEYAVLLAERLGYELLALQVGPPSWGHPLSAQALQQQEEFRQRAAEAAARLAQLAAARKIPVTHAITFGDPAKAVEEISRQYRRLELVLTDSRPLDAELPVRLNVPVFSLKTS